MSIGRKIAFAGIVIWMSRGLQILMGLTLLPVLFRHMPEEDLGLWMLLGQSWAVLGVLDFGFGATLIRQIAFVRGKHGPASDEQLSEEGKAQIAMLVATGRRVYRCLAVTVCLLSFGLGFYFLGRLDLHGVTATTLWTAWGILCLSQAITVWSSVWVALLQGVGYVGWDIVIAAGTGVLVILAQIVAVWLGGSLISLAVAAATGAGLQLFLILLFAKRRRPELFVLRGRWNTEAFKAMVPYAWRAWLTGIGIALVYNTDQFFVVGFEGANELPAYRAAFLILLNLHMLAGAFAGASYPFIGHLWAAGKMEELRHVARRNLRMGLLVVGIGATTICLLGDQVFTVWLGAGNFIGYPVLIIFAVLFVCEQQSYVLAQTCRATGDEAFAGWSLAGGLLKLGLAWILIHPWGLTGLALSTLAAQLVTSHWFILRRTLQRLQVSWSDYAKQILAPCGFSIAAAALLVWGMLRLCTDWGNWQTVIGAGALAGSVLLCATLCLVLRGTASTQAA